MTPSIAVPMIMRLPFSLRSVIRRRGKVIGPTAGVGIALAVVFALLNLTVINGKLIYGEYERSAANLYFIEKGGVIFPTKAGESVGSIDNARPLLRQVSAMPDVREVVALNQGSVAREKERDADGRKQTVSWPAVGVWGDPTRIPNMIEMKAGRWLERDDEVVLGPQMASQNIVGIGDVLTFSGQRREVVGIAIVRGAGYAGLSSAFFSYDSLLFLSGGKSNLTIGIVSTADPADTAEKIQAARRIAAYSAREIISQGESQASATQIIFGAISYLGLAIAGLFVGNVLTMSVSERRTEFATLRAIGMRRRSILTLVMTEALVIALSAFVIGASLGMLLTLALIALLPPVPIDPFDAGVFWQVFAVDLLLAGISGFLPARAALQVQPVEALREA